MPDYFERGFSVREPMWHGLGEVLEDYPGREAGMVHAGHDFTVIERPLYMAPTDLPEDGDVELDPVVGWKALCREDQPDVMFHVAKDSYGVIQPETLWDVTDAIVGLPNVRYETAGILKMGAILWVLAWLDEPQIVPGDISPIYPFCCVSTSHDGSQALKARSTSIRVVCWNTFSAAEAEGKQTGREFTFRHTKQVMDRIEDAKMALHGVRADHEEFMALANELAALPISKKGVEFFTGQFIPMPPEALVSDRVVGNIEKARAQVRAILDGPTINQERTQRNGWDLLQVGTEYLDHVRKFRSKDTYFGRSMLRDEPFKAKLLPLIREAATV